MFNGDISVTKSWDEVILNMVFVCGFLKLTSSYSIQLEKYSTPCIRIRCLVFFFTISGKYQKGMGKSLFFISDSKFFALMEYGLEKVVFVYFLKVSVALNLNLFKKFLLFYENLVNCLVSVRTM